jgi:hypothetical protein
MPTTIGGGQYYDPTPILGGRVVTTGAVTSSSALRGGIKEMYFSGTYLWVKV